jgi:hypothetical protein
MKRQSQREENDFYPTHAYVTLSLYDHEEFHTEIFDGSCGDGELILASKMRHGKNIKFYASDLIDRGFAIGNVDFLQIPDRVKYENVVMNPPFKHMNEFIPKSIHMAKSKVAIFARLAILEGGERFDIFQKYPPSRIHVFTERVTMYSRQNEIDIIESGKKLNPSTTASCWMIWDKNSTETWKMNLIPPGQKIKYANETHALRKLLVERHKKRHLCHQLTDATCSADLQAHSSHSSSQQTLKP